MAKKSYRCPTCGKELTREEYDEALGKRKERDRELKTEAKRAAKDALEKGRIEGAKQYKSQVDLLTKQNDRLQDTITMLKRGSTAQREGFEDEGVLCHELQEQYPDDTIEHKGKHGDILHIIRVGEKDIGRMVFECKREDRLTKSHIKQAYAAKEYRQADYAILVTKGKRKADPIFDGMAIVQSNDVYIVPPAVVMGLVNLLRGFIVDLHRANLPEDERTIANRRLADYLTNEEGAMAINAVTHHTLRLWQQLQNEIIQTQSLWDERERSIKTIGFAGFILKGNIELITAGREPLQLDLRKIDALPNPLMLQDGIIDDNVEE